MCDRASIIGSGAAAPFAGAPFLAGVAAFAGAALAGALEGAAFFGVSLPAAGAAAAGVAAFAGAAAPPAAPAAAGAAAVPATAVPAVAGAVPGTGAAAFSSFFTSLQIQVRSTAAEWFDQRTREGRCLDAGTSSAAAPRRLCSCPAPCPAALSAHE